MEALLSKSGAKLKYLKGKDNCLANFFSRYYAKQKAVINLIGRKRKAGPDVTPEETNHVSLEHLKDMQAKDTTIQGVIRAISKGSAIQEHLYSRMQQHLCVRQGELYVWHYDKLLAVIPPKDAEQFILKAHLDPLHTHLGADKLEHMLRQYVYTEHIHDKVKEVVKRCGACLQAAQLPHSMERAPIALKQPPSILSHIHVNHHGPWYCGRKKLYIWGATDSESKYMWTAISSSKKPSSAFKFLMNKIVYTVGLMDVVTSDRGLDFSSKVVEYLHQALKIDRIRTSSFSPQSNAQIERFWRTLDQQIRRNSTTFADVEELLIPTTFALNNAVNSATGYPPIYLLMAFKPQTGTLFQKVPRAPSSIIACDNDQIIERENRRRETFQEVHKRIHDRAKYNKEYHDSKGIQVKREIGDQVLVSNHSIPSFANRKLVPKWVPASKGLPFQVVDTSNDGINLTLKDPVNEKNGPCTYFLYHLSGDFRGVNTILSCCVLQVYL